jgi:glycine/D-amino acid oxidase-like deaminating enzyme
MNVVIAGGGMVGLTLGRLLRARGFEPTIIERMPEGSYIPRGYMLGFQGYEPLKEIGVLEAVWPEGREIAQHDGVNRLGYRVERFARRWRRWRAFRRVFAHVDASVVERLKVCPPSALRFRVRRSDDRLAFSGAWLRGPDAGMYQRPADNELACGRIDEALAVREVELITCTTARPGGEHERQRGAYREC